ncbi:helix-turn-helix domain-containing protein [Loigolactobacillus coryniformis]|jgi:transcriptional regulator with XRE-family HTH domain|uniref:XRE family transcriptional regulator n=2 Tax=Loigolactobacillus coryniformis TaxID=1610 RepID=A0A0R1EYP9_9LACO|nr:helix-turn-helix transcriptional regulator [Loigolactobacillus coryniformis]MDT3392213.1 helix-turn-helix domain-containing protein [Bacillota bacterium]ATO44132.1 XRE family transcriptional regulator [Loigolactobacillus coryniformis subsp. torquens DSM 20004 = KCTC 3535]ATO55799.1 XRE family transcriptional regulator [Loigolactobacillus coryniformis subsp. coryniformis KCTC 3167 = DSM 20001]KRK14669.1 XRE family transcriptional regulator [Loigolactobacillus coryniformis subsp. coryniformis 
MAASIGALLKQTRQAQHLAQKTVAAGICSQPMLSAIEHDKYRPNAQLLISLCQRLGISLTEISLAHNFAVSQLPNLNARLAELCNQHCYQALADFLQSEAVLANISSVEQTQAYYYYLAVATLQVSADLTETQRLLHLSLASTGTTNTTLARLARISLGLIAAKLKAPRRTEHAIDQAMHNLAAIPYTENQNILFYLVALSYFYLQQYTLSLEWVARGIKFTTAHDSHYMLANFYHLLAQTAQIEEKADLALVAQQREQIFAELFQEKTYDQF